MGLLDTIKSALGLGGSSDERSTETNVAVEHEPSTASEDAVKGTGDPEDGAAAAEDGVDEPVATETDASGSTESIVEEEEAAVDPAEAAEPAEAAGPGLEDKATDIETEEPEPGEETGADPDEGTSVEEIKGIGPAYGERLAESGVETVADLAAADPEDLAERTDLPPSRVADWVERAKEFEA